jgi:hypothetical protein
MEKKAKPDKSNPTIGPAFVIGNAAELKFRSWIPREWLVRDRRPDFFIDFMVETSDGGEPTAKHFAAQVKGRTAKPKNGQIKEKFETKHLRYYATCRDPVFLFRIDPDTNSGNWLFIQRYLKQKGVAEKLTTQGTMKVAFDPDCSLENFDLFRKELDAGWKFMSDEFPGSPVAALAKRKEFLESLDPNVVIELTATDTGVKTIVNPKPGAATAGPNIAGHFSEEQWEALNSGQPVTIQASKLKVDNPLAQHLLSEAGDKEIAIQRGINFPKITGSAQITLEGVSNFMLQLNGDWTMTPTRLSFEATLPEAPLRLKAVWIGEAPNKFGNPDVTFSFKYSNWAGQPLSHLAYFDDLKKLFENHPLRLRFLMRGQQLYTGKIESPDLSPGEWLAESVDWISKLKETAAYFGINPPFPGEGQLSNQTSVDVRMAVALATTGKCVLSYADRNFTATGVFPQAIEPHPTELGQMKFFNQYEELDFLGLRVKVGPMSLAWTNMFLIGVKEHKNGQKSLKWKGSSTGCLTLDLSDPAPPAHLEGL